MGQQNPNEKQMNDLQALGMELTKLSTDTLKKIGLDEDLYEAVVTYKKITSNGALKRQSQFIGRLMRDTDPAPIEAFLAKLRGENTAHNAFLQRVEQARTRLLADDNAITQFMADFPHADAGKLRTLIRNTKKEQEQNKPPKNFRALFQENQIRHGRRSERFGRKRRIGQNKYRGRLKTGVGGFRRPVFILPDKFYHQPIKSSETAVAVIPAQAGIRVSALRKYLKAAATSNFRIPSRTEITTVG